MDDARHGWRGGLPARQKTGSGTTHDPLTGLWNRAAILDTLQRELARAERQRTNVAILMADLDHFKQINDAYGHLAGDAVLRDVSQRMRAAVRSYDAIGRYGGEEFLIVTPGCNVTTALKLGERVRSCISREPIDIAGRTFPATLSLGVAATSEAGDADQLVRAPDAALYRAKNAGRNRVELALP